ncbi:phage scaffolding protein [Streptomyces uncialis]|uniref:phage scaffolding protein n=1 Tax=Streptomyces uncialis TaxID=1048205 RepID=UPI003667038A
MNRPARPARPTLSGISLPPGTILGYAGGRPVYNIAGGAPDDVEVDDAPDDTGTDTDDEPDDDEGSTAGADRARPKPPAGAADDRDTETGGGGGDDYQPPSREEWDRVRRTMAKRKEEKLTAQRELNALRDKYKEQETESEKAVREAREEAEARYKPMVVRKTVRAALIQAGATTAVEGDKDKTEARLSRLMKLIDIGDLSIDDDGEVLGVDEQIDGLRADYPELFEAPAKTKPRVRPTGAPRKPADDKPKSAAERHAARLLGRD